VKHILNSLLLRLVWKLWAVVSLDHRQTWRIEEVVEVLVVVVATLVAAVAKDEEDATLATPTTSTSARMQEALAAVTRAAATQAMPSRCARSVSKPAILLTNVGTGSRKIMFLKRDMPALP
jgi:hypothetical protein